MKKVALGLIHFYQATWSRVTPHSCCFTPTCSHYGHEAIQRYGLLKGGWLTLKRIARCHPFSHGGFDPVP